MSVSWLSTGSDSKKIAEQAAAEVEKRKAEQGKLFRFWLKENEEANITFVDGALSEEGYLLPPRFFEHQLFLNGSWNNTFVCPEKTLPHAGDKCPICESGDFPSLIALFTVIDHRTFQSKDKTKTYTDTPKLFAAKAQTFEMLNKLAMKLGGLAGQTFNVSRVGDKAAAVGSMFIPMGKESIEVLQQKYTREVVDPKTNQKTLTTIFVPADYSTEIVFRTGDELRKLGLGKPGYTPAQTTTQNTQSMQSAPAASNYGSQL